MRGLPDTQQGVSLRGLSHCGDPSEGPKGLKPVTPAQTPVLVSCFPSPKILEIYIVDTLDDASSGVPCSPWLPISACPLDTVVKDPGHWAKQIGLLSNASSATLSL